ncbi:hypothetical protein [Campylobacter taeniopygiae]|uniref:hypothetical protein n=1 Tax=Campylobacter taeniopygiae TaxID=2510188 RepID=UPI003D6B9F28
MNDMKLVITSRTDGFGSRMLSFLNVMYIANKINVNFGFVWKKRFYGENEVFVDCEENIFSKDYIKKHSFTNKIDESLEVDFFPVNDFNDFNDFKRKYKEYIYFYYNIPDVLDSKHIKKIDLIDYQNAIPELWNSIDFSEEYKRIISEANLYSKSIGKYISFQLRSGDAVYSDNLRENISPIRKSRFSPVELVLYKIIQIKNENPEYNILLVSEDLDAISVIQRRLKDENIDIYIISQFNSHIVDPMQKTLFDLIMLSKSKIMYSPSRSVYGLLASVLGGARLDSFLDKDDSSQYDVMNKYIKSFYVNDLQKALSYFYLYNLAEKLGKSDELKILYLESALSFDKYNCAYIILLTYLYIKNNQYEKANQIIKLILEIKHDRFFKVLFNKEFEKYLLNRELEYFLNIKADMYPYLCYLASKVCSEKGFLLRSYLYAFLSYKHGWMDKNIKHFFSNIKNMDVKNLIFDNKYCAEFRIKNHLSYLIGQELINSYKKRQYIYLYPKIFKIYIKYLCNRTNENSVSLSDCIDYESSKSIMECFTYRLGKEFIYATKNWYKGGYVIFLIRLKKGKI